MPGKIHIVKILNYRNLYKAVKKSIHGRFKYKAGALRFCKDKLGNIRLLKYLINNLMYQAGTYSKFFVLDSKRREIHAPCFIDKLVQYAINNIMSTVIEKTFISDSYACIKGKGPKAAVEKIKIYQRRAYKHYKEPILVKIDLSKFFYSINRSAVFDILCKKISCVDTRILLVEKLKFNVSKKGLPLGNLTSQQFANILLNQFDHYVKRVLRVKYYIRYADDMFFIVDSKENAKKLLEHCREWIKYNLDLNTNPKKCFYRPANEIVGLGYKIFIDKEMQMLSRSRKKLYKILNQTHVIDKSLMGTVRRVWIKNKRTLYRPITVEDTLIRLNSWYGHAKLVKIHSYIYRTLERCGRTDIIFTGEKFVAL